MPHLCCLVYYYIFFIKMSKKVVCILISIQWNFHGWVWKIGTKFIEWSGIKCGSHWKKGDRGLKKIELFNIIILLTKWRWSFLSDPKDIWFKLFNFNQIWRSSILQDCSRDGSTRKDVKDVLFRSRDIYLIEGMPCVSYNMWFLSVISKRVRSSEQIFVLARLLDWGDFFELCFFKCLLDFYRELARK